jgi:hypothetical protein
MVADFPGRDHFNSAIGAVSSVCGIQSAFATFGEVLGHSKRQHCRYSRIKIMPTTPLISRYRVLGVAMTVVIC